jgi:hypothetical protein
VARIQENRGASRGRRAPDSNRGFAARGRSQLLRTLFAFTLLGSAVAGERVYFDEQNYKEHEIAAYNRAVKAVPIDPRDGNQARVWMMGYWSRRMQITGYILTAKGVYRCKLSYNNDNGKYMVINPGQCAGPRMYPEKLQKALAALPELAKHDSESASCEVMDGWGADIEGMVDGKRFQFTASNPDECESAKPVNAILELIESAYYKKNLD